jgi:hypothetical protein
MLYGFGGNFHVASRTFHGVPMRMHPFIHKRNALIHGYVNEPVLLQSCIRGPAVGDHCRSGLYPFLIDNHQCRCCAVLHGHQESSPRFPLDATEHPINLHRPPAVVLPTWTLVYLSRLVCFVYHASLYNLVHKANLVHSFS